MLTKRRIFAVLFSLATTVAHAGGVVFYPAPGIFVEAQPSDGRSTLISADFDAFIRTPANRDMLVSAFRQSVATKLPNVVDKIVPSQKSRVLVMSLQVTRASRFEVPKLGGVLDAYYPITASLYFTNPNTGEVAYTTAWTETAVRKEQTGQSGEHVSIYANGLKHLIDELVGKASAEFKLSGTVIPIRAIQDGYVVLGAGQRAGLAVGNSIVSMDGNAMVRIVFVEDQYSIAVVDMGDIKSLKPGMTLGRDAPQTNAANKPKVLVLGQSEYSGWGPNDVVVQFADGLKDAPFTNLYLNPLFSSVLSTIAAETGFSPKDVSRRALPDLFLRVRALNPVGFQTKTNLVYKDLHGFRGYALGELIDRSGRVVYANYSDEAIDDEVTSGMAFSELDRKDVVLKNALISLATKFSKDVVVRRQKMPVTSIEGDAIRVADPTGVLSPGMTVTLYREMKTKTENFMLPAWELNVVEVRGGIAIANKSLEQGQLKIPPAIGDWVVVDAASNKPAQGQRLTRCPNDPAPLGLALSALPELGWAIYGRFAGAALYSPDTIEQINGLVSKTSDFETDMVLKTPESTECVQAAYRVDVGEPQCLNGYCGKPYIIRTGYRIRRGEEVLKRAGLEGKVKTAGSFTGTRPLDAEQKDSAEVLQYALPLLMKLAIEAN
jgi:hypothetical protein